MSNENIGYKFSMVDFFLGVAAAFAIAIARTSVLREQAYQDQLLKEKCELVIPRNQVCIRHIKYLPEELK